MSIALMSLAWKADLPTGRKMVLLALCDNANDQGECYPSVSNIAERCSMGERTVQSHLSDMEDDGILSRHFRNGRSSIYVINPRRFRTPAESAPPQISHPTPAESAPPPPQNSHPTPADFAPRNINESSFESSLNQVYPKKQRTKAKKTTFPEEWILPLDWGDWTLNEFPDWQKERIKLLAERFADHWRSKGEARSDWLATWRNWCRNERDWSGQRSKSASSSKASKREEWVSKMKGQANGSASGNDQNGNGRMGNGRIIDLN